MLLKIGKKKLLVNNPETKNLAILLLLDSLDLNSPLEALKINLVGVLKIGGEFRPALLKKIKSVERITTMERFIKLYYNLYLHYNKMGLCYGFSCSCPIGFGKSNYDPERIRLTKNWTKKNNL